MPHYEKPSFHLICFPSGPIGTNAYLIICKKTKEAALVDAPSDSLLKIQRAVTKHEAHLTQLILTHSHWDHIAEAAKYVVPLLVHSEDADNLTEPGSDGISTWMSIEAVKPTTLLKDQDLIQIGTTCWQVIHTPGHSPGSICLYCEVDKTCLTGDTLFKGSIGRLDLPTGEPERMWPSLKKLALLPSDTHCFPGHGPSTTIGQEPWLISAEEYFGS